MDSQAVIGRRIGAALIDIVLLAAVFVGLAAAAGDLTTDSGNVHVGLNGAPAIIYFAVVFGYYWACEAFWRGQTLGKRLVGVRVVQADGSPPTGAQAAIRTALRIVDALPFLYFVGFVCVLATGAKAQRIGDLAATTFVVDAKRS